MEAKFFQRKIFLESFSKFWIYLGAIPLIPDIIKFYFPELNIPDFINWKLSVILFVFLYVVSYILTFFREQNKTENEKIVDILKEKEQLAKDLSEKEKAIYKERIKNKEWETVISTLKNKSLLKENLIRKYSSSLPIILLQYGNQKVNNKPQKCITEELENNYNVKSLGGSLKVIPPSHVPKNVKNGKDLKEWFNKKIQSKYKGASCVVSVLAILDLKNVYWKTDYDFKTRYYSTLGEVLGLDDIFSSEEISKLLSSENISIVEPILDGDIAFLCSTFLTDKEMKIIYKNQELIENELNYSLIDFANEDNIPKIKSVLKRYFPNVVANSISERINKEAKYWNNKLNKEKKK